MTIFNRLLVLLLTACLFSSCATTIVFVVRHAEKVDDTDSTNLSPAGRQRAVALADTLARRGIDAIFSTPYRRTRQTAQPFANRTGIPIADYTDVSALANRIQDLRGRQVLVVGHSNTILSITSQLGTAPAKQRIGSGDYDNLLVIRLWRGPFHKSATLAEETYGVPTAP